MILSNNGHILLDVFEGDRSEFGWSECVHYGYLLGRRRSVSQAETAGVCGLLKLEITIDA